MVWAYSKKRAARDNQTLTAQANRPGPSSPTRSILRTLVLPAVHAGDATLDEASLAVSRHFQDVTITLDGHHLTAADPLTPEAEDILTALNIPTGH